MTDSTDDLDHVSIESTYCPKHPGLWPHECKHWHKDEPKTKLQKAIKALKGVIAVADRNTDEFNYAREVLKELEGR